MTADQSTHVAPPEPSDVRFSIRSLLAIMVAVAFAAALFGTVLRRLDSPTQRAAVLLFGALAFLFVGATVVVGLLRYRAEQRAGCVLFRLARHSYFTPRAPRIAAIAGGAALLALGVLIWGIYASIVMFDTRSPNNPTGHGPAEAFVGGLYGIGWGGLFVTMGIGAIWWSHRIRLCERGLVTGFRFVSWEQCGKYYWDACYPNVLVLAWSAEKQRRAIAQAAANSAASRQVAHRQATILHLAIRVPPDKRAAVENLFKEKLSVRPAMDAVRETTPRVLGESR
jgi:hypothetical protein